MTDDIHPYIKEKRPHPQDVQHWDIPQNSDQLRICLLEIGDF